MKIYPVHAAALLTLSSLVANLNAASLVNYGFDDASFNQDLITSPIGADSTGTNNTSSNFTVGSVSLAQGNIDRGDPAPSVKTLFSGGNFDSSSLANALTGNKYVGFTLTPDANYGISFSDGDTFSLDGQLYYAGTGTGPLTTNVHFALFSSVDGFTETSAQIGTTQTLTLTGNGGDSTAFTTENISLSGLGNIGTDTSLEFRVYIYADFSGSGVNFSSRHLYLDNFEVTGATAIPESSAFPILAGAFGLTFVLFRVYRKSRKS